MPADLLNKALRCEFPLKMSSLSRPGPSYRNAGVTIGVHHVLNWLPDYGIENYVGAVQIR
jgi:hypothetical protein